MLSLVSNACVSGSDGPLLDGGLSRDAGDGSTFVTEPVCFHINDLSPGQKRAFDELDGTGRAEYASTYLTQAQVECIAVRETEGQEDQTAELVMATQLAHLSGLPVHIIGSVGMSAPLVLQSGTRLLGRDEGARLSAVRRPLESLLRVAPEATDLSLERLTLDEGTGVGSGLFVLGGMNRNIRVEGVRFRGSHDVGTSTASAILMPRDWVEVVTIRDANFRGLAFAVNVGANIHDLEVSDCEFSEWQYYAVRISPGATRSGADSGRIQITQNTFRDPSVSPVGPAAILVSRGQNRNWTSKVTVAANQVVGPGIPYTQDTAAETNALGDVIVLHGVSDFEVRSNTISGGGENGITVSRLSRNGTVTQNTVFDNDAFGLNIGSGYYEITVDNPSRFGKGDEIRGQTSGTSARVEGVNGDVLALSPVWGGNIFRNEAIDNVTRAQPAAANISMVDRTRVVILEQNTIYNNGINHADELAKTWEVLVINADAITFRRNEVYSTPERNLTEHNLFHLANSRNIAIEQNNLFQLGSRSRENSITMTRSSWLAPD